MKIGVSDRSRLAAGSCQSERRRTSQVYAHRQSKTDPSKVGVCHALGTARRCGTFAGHGYER
jgi:hypothetical protein